MSENPIATSADRAPDATTDSEARSAGDTAAPATVAVSSKDLAPRSGSRKAGKQTVSSPIEQAVALKTSLLQSLNQTGELIRTLKRHKKQSRMLTSTLRSLKELQKAGYAQANTAGDQSRTVRGGCVFA